MSLTLLPDSAPTVAQAAALLRAGKLLILPTETIYGLTLNLRSPEARARVKSLKNLGSTATEPLNPPWVLHVGHPEEALRLLPGLAPVGRRLIRKAWPGPIALQVRFPKSDLAALRAYLADAALETLIHDPCPATKHAVGGGLSDSLLTLRCPDVVVTQDILSACDFPVAILAVAPGAYDASSIPQPMAESIDAIIDAGPTRYRKPSTLVRIEGDRYQVLRPGIIDDRIIHRMADFLMLFVCSGNTCRSPMAAGIATRLLAEQLHTTPEKLAEKHVLVQSAGLHANRGMRATPEAVSAAADWGANLTGHLSQPATLDLLRRADVIYTMTQAHQDEILDLLPGADKKTSRLDSDTDIDDPIGAEESVYRQVAAHLQDALRSRLKEIEL